LAILFAATAPFARKYLVGRRAQAVTLPYRDKHGKVWTGGVLFVRDGEVLFID
jgi:hypothetical protein